MSAWDPSSRGHFEFWGASQGSFSGPIGKKLIVIGNPKHGAFALRIAHLIRAGARFLSAVAPMRRVVKEGSISHFPAVAREIITSMGLDNSSETEPGLLRAQR